MNTIELIHNEFDTSVDKLLQLVEDNNIKADSLVEKEINDKNKLENSEFLLKIGFNNVPVVKEINDLNSFNKKILLTKEKIIQKNTNLSFVVSKYKKSFPEYKFILLSQIYNICEKYNLYIAHSSLYKGNIPQKNIDELKRFPFDEYFNEKYYFYIDKSKPLCDQINNNSSKYIKYYICASYNDFLIDKNTHIIGKEIFKNEKYEKPSFKLLKPKKVPDPIILIPVNISPIPTTTDIGFLVNTKWGKEGNDDTLQNNVIKNLLDS
jgi:hypothetical protein